MPLGYLMAIYEFLAVIRQIIPALPMTMTDKHKAELAQVSIWTEQPRSVVVPPSTLPWLAIYFDGIEWRR